MKYLLVLLVVVIAVGIWRNKRRVAAFEQRSTASARPAASRQLQTMVACAHCGLHLPQSDALLDQSGEYFCSAEHRQLAAQSKAKS